MASAVKRPEGFIAPRAEGAGAGVPVILDSGTSVQVAPIDVGRPLRVGTRFEFGGTMWEITREKDYTRGWVARPVRTRISCAPR